MKAVSRISNNLNGEIVCPGDKSISQRSVILGSLLDTDIKISGFLFAEDPLSTVNAMRSLGNNIEIQDETVVIKNSEKSKVTKKVFCNLGNSGTGMRLIAGLIAGQKLNVELSGDESLSSRPMGRIIEPLIKMGAKIESNDGCAPLVFSESILLDEFYFKMPIASAQVKSAILLAGLNAEGKTQVQEKYPTRDHTERMMKTFEANISSSKGIIEIERSDLKTPGQIEVPGDFSSAAFFIGACLISENSEIKIKNVGINNTRKAFLDCLLDMNANIDLANIRQLGNEEVADLVIKSSDLLPAKIMEDIVPNLIDELPLFFLIASLIDGESEFNGLSELKHKESDRLSIMINNLQKLDVEVQLNEDSLKIIGKKDRIFPDELFDSHGDHRIAMTMLVAGLRSTKGLTINNLECINTSFPEFIDQAKTLGFSFKNG